MRVILRIVTDTAMAPARSGADTPAIKLTAAAVARAKRQYGVDRAEDLANALGLTRPTMYRLLSGANDIRLSRAMAIAEKIGWPLARVFEQVDRG